MLESQLSGRTAVRSLEPSRVEMIPFWSTFRIMVASTKYMRPFLSTAIPEQDKWGECVSRQGAGLWGEGGDALLGLLFWDLTEMLSHSEQWFSAFKGDPLSHEHCVEICIIPRVLAVSSLNCRTNLGLQMNQGCK